MHKVCKIHGELGIKDIYTRMIKAGTARVECKLCRPASYNRRNFKVKRNLPDVVKICKVHGDLAPEHIYYRERPEAIMRFECKICRHISASKTKGTPERAQISNKSKRKQVDNLTYSYLTDRLRAQGFPVEAITTELMDLKKVLIMIHRAIRQKDDANDKVKD